MNDLFNQSIHNAVYQKQFKSRIDKDITFDYWEFLRCKIVLIGAHL